MITDSVIALVLIGLALSNLQAYWDLRPPLVHPFLAIALTILAIIPLIWRRRFPLAVLMMVAVMLIILRGINIPEMNFTAVASVVALFSAAAYGARWRTLVCGISTAAIIGSIIHDSLFDSTVIILGNEILFNVSTLLWNTIVLAGAWWFGNTVRIRREQTLQLQERTEQLAREREENARRAVLGERVRIARELHDVVAHHVSLMGIHAGAAREVLDKQPERALNSLNLIETSSRQAVAELYRLLDLLRDEKQVDKFTSQPGLNQLDKLVAEMQKAGLSVEVKIEGEKHEIPQSVDLSAYRIAEEALTNTLKHAGPAKATVTIGYRDDALYLEILDSGHGALFTNGKQIKGKGLIGMRERVNLLNGEFWAGNAPNSGFCVRAKLPLA